LWKYNATSPNSLSFQTCVFFTVDDSSCTVLPNDVSINFLLTKQDLYKMPFKIEEHFYIESDSAETVSVCTYSVFSSCSPNSSSLKPNWSMKLEVICCSW